MAYTASQYREHLKALLPPGLAFPRERGTTLDDLLDAMAQELARIDARADRLTVEANPSTTAEMLADWERVAGLPDNCSGMLPETLQGRRADLVSKLSSTGGQSRAYFIALAAALGFVIEIEEFRPFRAGWSNAGDALTNGDWVYTWRVRGPEETITYFRAGVSAAGEPLAYWGNDALECRIRKLKPAHTIVLFAYGGSGLALLLGEEGGALLNSGGEAILLETT
ncbi:MAG TPA: putative phage tail protein [Pseudoxanthomonas sp.]